MSATRPKGKRCGCRDEDGKLLGSRCPGLSGRTRRARWPRLNGGHCALVFDRIDDINDEIAAARAGERAPVLEDDVRQRARVTGLASQHRVYAALREFCNHAWTAAEAARFLSATADDPLGLMLRIVVLRGAAAARSSASAGMAPTSKPDT